MRRFALVLSLMAAAPLFAAAADSGTDAKPGFQKPYFASTVPGSWSRYAVTSGGKTESEYTYRRLPDEEGHVQVELKTDFTGGQFQGTWSKNRYVLLKRHNFDQDALSFMKNCEHLFMQTDKMPTEQELPETTLPYIVNAGIDYARSVRFVGTGTIEGRTCDHYTYHFVSSEENTTTYDGELWMNPDVPFGIVRESAKLTLKTGPDSSYSMTLVDSGKDPAVVPAEPSK